MKPQRSLAPAALRRAAEARLRQRRDALPSEAGERKSEADPRRLLHELQVHQVELEMQNAELQEARDRVENLLEKYTDLYDFAPVGYFSLDDQGRVLEANLTGAGLLGVERSRLINRPLTAFVAPSSRPIFLEFLKRLSAGAGKQRCEAALIRAGAKPFWAGFHGTCGLSADARPPSRRVAVADITSLKQAEEAQQRMESLAAANQELRREIIRRQAVEQSLKRSREHQARHLEQSRHMQEQLRHLSRQVLRAQEAERQRVSRELHDVIAQTLTIISVRLETLKKEASLDVEGIGRKLAGAQRLVEHSAGIIHQFIHELRPTVLDDLGLIPALQGFVKRFRAETGIQIRMSAAAAVERINGDQRTVLYRVAQEALANIARHAQASRIELRIQKRRRDVAMSIRDDGRGFDPEGVFRGRKKNRLGLLGMRERVEMLGGAFRLQSAPGQGTTVAVRIPLAETGEAV